MRGRTREEGAEFPVAPLRSSMPTGYTSLIGDLKEQIQQSRLHVAASVNQELLLLYYSMGYDLDRRYKKKNGVEESLIGYLRTYVRRFRK